MSNDTLRAWQNFSVAILALIGTLTLIAIDKMPIEVGAAILGFLVRTAVPQKNGVSQ